MKHPTRLLAVVVLMAGMVTAPAAAGATRAPATVIAFETVGPNEALHLYTLDLTSHARRLLVDGSTPAWSPDGRRLAFISTGQEIVIRNADGTITHTGVIQFPNGITARGDRMAWSPDGRHLAYFGSDGSFANQGIWVINTRAPYDPRLVVLDAAQPSWSPDGTRIMFAAAETPGTPSEIHIRDLDGSHDVQLTHTASADIALAQWSPDGSMIIYFENAFNEPGAPQATGLWVAQADASHPHLLYWTHDEGWSTTWAPDSGRIAISVCCDGRAHRTIETIRPDGTDRQVVLSRPRDALGVPELADIAWRP